MNKEINLLKIEQKTVPTIPPIVQKLRLFSVGLLVFIALIAVVIFIVKLQVPLPQIRSDEQTASNTLATLSDKKAKLYLSKQRFDYISTVFADRTNYDKIIDFINTGLPADVKLSGLALDPKHITFSVTSSSLLSLKSYFETFKSASKAKKVSRLLLTNLSLDVKGGVYTANLELDISNL